MEHGYHICNLLSTLRSFPRKEQANQSQSWGFLRCFWSQYKMHILNKIIWSIHNLPNEMKNVKDDQMFVLFW